MLSTVGKNVLRSTSSRILVQCPRRMQSHVSEAFSPLQASETETKVQLRGRPFLPGADKETFPSFLKGPRPDFPLILKANESKTLQDWGNLCREVLDKNLLKYGAVLFRELPVNTREDFQALFAAIGYPGTDYVGGSGHREALGPHIYSASDEPPEFCIELHNELSYMPVFNNKVGVIFL